MDGDKKGVHKESGGQSSEEQGPDAAAECETWRRLMRDVQQRGSHQFSSSEKEEEEEEGSTLCPTNDLSFRKQKETFTQKQTLSSSHLALSICPSSFIEAAWCPLFAPTKVWSNKLKIRKN